MKKLELVDIEKEMYSLDKLDTFEKASLVNLLLDRAANAHIDLEKGSDQVHAIYYLTLARRVINELENEFIYSGI